MNFDYIEFRLICIFINPYFSFRLLTRCVSLQNKKPLLRMRCLFCKTFIIQVWWISNECLKLQNEYLSSWKKWKVKKLHSFRWWFFLFIMNENKQNVRLTYVLLALYNKHTFNFHIKWKIQISVTNNKRHMSFDVHIRWYVGNDSIKWDGSIVGTYHKVSCNPDISCLEASAFQKHCALWPKTGKCSLIIWLGLPSGKIFLSYQISGDSGQFVYQIVVVDVMCQLWQLASENLIST